jgi:hypothetical protein
MKKIISLLLLIILLCATFYWGFTNSKPKRRSNIIVEKVKVEKKANNKYVVQIPMATLPKPGKIDNKKYDILEGNVTQIPGDEKDASSKKIIILVSKNNENIVLTNIPYVHTLELVYLGKSVKLQGNWLKNAVIFGKEYKSFWVEDIALVK